MSTVGASACPIHKRCEEGIERAKAKGVTFGRKRKLDAEIIRVAAERYAKGETMAELAEVYGVSATSFRTSRRPLLIQLRGPT